MNRTIASLAISAALCACTRAPAPSLAPEPTPADLATARAEIAPLFAEMLRAANAHDAAAHLAAYARTPALVFVVNDEMIQGWDSLLVRQRQWWQDGKSDAVYALADSARYAMPARGIVVQTYALSSRRGGAAGVAREARLTVTDVWQKRPEGWRIVYAHEAVGAR